MDAFTPEQLAVLKADPMLIVVERDKASGQNDTARGMNCRTAGCRTPESQRTDGAAGRRAREGPGTDSGA
ncbi:hypothetical protein [Escherichia coli]|uniref:hypothetical protein n=1 Tax=Escherichia coli TaxID=562 RepID=UPI002FCD1E82